MTDTERLPQDETDPPPLWVTVSIHPPSPNCYFAGFIDPATDTVEARAIDFMALQELAIDDDDDVEPATRIIGIVMDWTGTQIVCAHDAGNGFAGFATGAAKAEEQARQVLAQYKAQQKEQADQAAAP